MRQEAPTTRCDARCCWPSGPRISPFPKAGSRRHGLSRWPSSRPRRMISEAELRARQGHEDTVVGVRAEVTKLEARRQQLQADIEGLARWAESQRHQLRVALEAALTTVGHIDLSATPPEPAMSYTSGRPRPPIRLPSISRAGPRRPSRWKSGRRRWWCLRPPSRRRSPSPTGARPPWRGSPTSRRTPPGNRGSPTRISPSCAGRSAIRIRWDLARVVGAPAGNNRGRGRRNRGAQRRTVDAGLRRGPALRWTASASLLTGSRRAGLSAPKLPFAHSARFPSRMVILCCSL